MTDWAALELRSQLASLRVFGVDAEYLAPGAAAPVAVRGILSTGEADPNLGAMPSYLVEPTFSLPPADADAAGLVPGGRLTVSERIYDLQRPRHRGADWREYPVRTR